MFRALSDAEVFIVLSSRRLSVDAMHARSDPGRADEAVAPQVPQLEVIPVMGDGLVRLELHGQLDMSTVGALVRPLLDAEDVRPGWIVIDLHDVTLLDAAGLRVFLDAARRAERQERRFAVARPDPETARVLRLTGLDQSIAVLSQLPT
jgi:anti-anti-sigma factor